MAQERPNTISGLQAKRAAVLKPHGNLFEDAKRVLCDIDPIDATVRVFYPQADIFRRTNNRYAVKRRAVFGQQCSGIRKG